MKNKPSSAKTGSTGASPSRQIDARIDDLRDWRGETLARLRKLIKAAVPDVVEELKWGGVPVWSHDGIICTGETYKHVVKATFARGAALDDPAGLFNSSLEGNTRRAIDFHQGDPIDERALKALIREAVALNTKTAAAKNTRATVTKRAAAPAATKPKLLSGGNPQIPKGDGDAPVQAWIEALPGWKRDVGRQLDALITRTIPGVAKAVKWNSPFYGVEGNGWFLGMHCLTKAVKLGFFKGASLKPLPPGKSTQKDVRYLDIREDEPLDEQQLASWIRQASELPGWVP